MIQIQKKNQKIQTMQYINRRGCAGQLEWTYYTRFFDSTKKNVGCKKHKNKQKNYIYVSKKNFLAIYKKK